MTLSPTVSDTNAKILYIDDDPVNRLLVNRLLTSYNFRVIEAETGLEGIRIAKQEIPDLILMDINMPGLDGHETTTRMRTLAGLKTTPIVAVTANMTTGDRELALAAGCDGYINKPIDIDQFPHQIMTYLEGRKETITGAERQHYLDKYSQRLVERLEAKIVELEEANTRLQKVDKLKSDFITVAAHELRTPITLVYGYSRLLQSAVRDLEQDMGIDESVSDLTGRIYHSVHRLNEVVNDILNISLIEADEMNLEQMSISLGAVIKAALRELDLSKNSRTLNITLENLESLPDITGDAERLQQAFWNILSNAIKFTPDHGSILIKGWVAQLPEPASKIKPFAEAASDVSSQGSIIIMIRDTGIGIDPSEQKEIFNRFYMIADTAYHSSSKTAFGGGGMGLGLPIAKGIIEAHGGRIWVESAGRNMDEYPGSTFYILLPLSDPKIRRGS